MSYRNVYPTSHNELAEALPHLNSQFLEAFPNLLRKAIAYRPQTAVETFRAGAFSGNVAEINDPDFVERWMAEPTSLHYPTETHVVFPLDNSVLMVSHLRGGRDALTVKTMLPSEPVSSESLLAHIPAGTESRRVFSLTSFDIDEGHPGHSFYMHTPATYRALEDDIANFYYFSSDNVDPGLPYEDSGQAPYVNREALPDSGQRILDQYGPFGVVKYEIEQDITLLRNVAERYS